MHFGKVNLSDWHLVAGVFEIVFEQLEIAFVHLVDQMHRQIVEIVFDRVCPFGPVPFAFVKAGDFAEFDLLLRVHLIQHVCHAVVEAFGPEDVVVAAAVHDERADMSGHRGPVYVRVHRATPANRVAREKKEAPKALDLVEFRLAVFTADFDPVFLDQKRDKISAIPLAVALDAADLVEERT